MKIDLRDKLLIGVSKKLRCAWYEVAGIGRVCSKCGKLKPKVSVKETLCGGVQKYEILQLRHRREQSIPSIVLTYALGRQKGKGDDIDPAIFQALAAAANKPFLGLDKFAFREQVDVVLDDGKTIFQGVDAANSPRQHTLGVAMLCLKLADQRLIEEATNQAVLVSLRLLEEAEDPTSEWTYIEGTVQPLADDMRKRANVLGYYGNPMVSAGGLPKLA